MNRLTRNWREYIAKPELVFISLATVMGVLSALLVPQLTVSDENMHFLRAYNLASGSIGNNNCIYPVDINKKAASIYEGDLNAHYSEKVNYDHTINASCGTAAAYSPLMHLPQAIGILLGKLVYPSAGVMVLLGRLVNLAFYLATLYFIIKRVKFGKWAFVVVALLPMMVHIAGSLSSDVMNNVVIFAAIAIIFNLFSQKSRLSRKQLALVVGLTCGLALTKLTNLVFLLPLLFLPVRMFNKNKLNFTLPFNIRKWLLVVVCGASALVCVFLWQKLYGGNLVTNAPLNSLDGHPLHFFRILFNTYVNPFIGYGDQILRGAIGDFASYAYHLPTFVIFTEICLLLFVTLYKNKYEDKVFQSISKYLTWSSLGTLCLVITLTTYALYTTWAVQPFRLGSSASYADGTQGRYFIAAIPLIIPFLAWARRYVSITVKSEVIVGVVVFFTAAFSLLFYLLETYYFFNSR